MNKISFFDNLIKKVFAKKNFAKSDFKGVFLKGNLKGESFKDSAIKTVPITAGKIQAKEGENYSQNFNSSEIKLTDTFKKALFSGTIGRALKQRMEGLQRRKKNWENNWINLLSLTLKALKSVQNKTVNEIFLEKIEPAKWLAVERNNNINLAYLSQNECDKVQARTRKHALPYNNISGNSPNNDDLFNKEDPKVNLLNQQSMRKTNSLSKKLLKPSSEEGGDENKRRFIAFFKLLDIEEAKILKMFKHRKEEPFKLKYKTLKDIMRNILQKTPELNKAIFSKNSQMQRAKELIKHVKKQYRAEIIKLFQEEKNLSHTDAQGNRITSL